MISESEQIERLNIVKRLSKIHPGQLPTDVAKYTGGFVDSGGLKYNAILGVECKWGTVVSIERLREIVKNLK